MSTAAKPSLRFGEFDGAMGDFLVDNTTTNFSVFKGAPDNVASFLSGYGNVV
jgi:hypothetical protein